MIIYKNNKEQCRHEIIDIDKDKVLSHITYEFLASRDIPRKQKVDAWEMFFSHMIDRDFINLRDNPQETFTIKNRFDDLAIYETEAESLKEAVEKAVIERVSLTGANLRGAIGADGLHLKDQ